MAEQVAVALAMQDCKRPHIYTDPRAAVRVFASEMIAREAGALLKSKSTANSASVLAWFPTHVGDDVLPGRRNPNEVADRLARELTRRGGGETSLDLEEIGHRDPLLTFRAIVSHYREERKRFPPPHQKLCRSQAITLIGCLKANSGDFLAMSK